MLELFNAAYISLHVRETNFAAFHLYRDTLKFAVHGTEAKYYADGENAFDMRKVLTREVLGLPPLPPPPPAAPAAEGGSGGKRGRAGGGAASGPRAQAEGAGAAAAAGSGGGGDGTGGTGGSGAEESDAVIAAVAAAGGAADIEPGKVGEALASRIAAIELD
jgi:hypothetical protein